MCKVSAPIPLFITTRTFAEPFQYAVKIKLIVANLPDLVESPKKNNYVVSFYNAEELDQLLAVIRGERIELSVILATFYGLSRSEVVGLKWSAIDLLNWTINIKHTAYIGQFEW
ncbi:integrase [Paenibacillus sp. S02]|uniref:integrase n=1 Tax=Paenibacillus sp. S02 TaxID=2823904 RepID=UPI0021ACB351|nr:integrase [Paenibacillus sp. S02]QYK69283.1 hypothetical protein KAI36_04453 [Paenibacillus sp. S02]